MPNNDAYEEPPELLAVFMDHCWEPEDAPTWLYYQVVRDGAYDTEAADAAYMVCLRVVGKDVNTARMLGPEDEVPTGELPATAEYLWVLWTDGQPSREALIALYESFPTGD